MACPWWGYTFVGIGYIQMDSEDFYWHTQICEHDEENMFGLFLARGWREGVKTSHFSPITNKYI